MIFVQDYIKPSEPSKRFAYVLHAGMIISPAEVKAHLKYILDDPAPPNEFPVGIMTSQDRDTWTVVRRKLVEAGA